MTVTNEERVGLPPLSANRRATWDRYRLEFLADGYPGRRVDGIVRPHPVYGTYVIVDYLGQYERTQDQAFLKAAVRVAEAAVDRMESSGDGIAFRYKPHTGISPLSFEFYSGSTQSRYLSALGRLDAEDGRGRFADARAGILRSLTLPVEQGGLARRTPGGHLALEEHSGQAPTYALGSWAAATALVQEYAVAADDDEARDVASESALGLAELLPAYDVPELALTRARLSGTAALRLSLQQPGGTVRQSWLHDPHHGRFELGDESQPRHTNRWTSGIDADGSLVRTTGGLEVVLCRATWPLPTRLHLEIEVDEPGRFALKIGQGRYDPAAKSVPVEDWAVTERGQLSTGRNVLDLDLRWHLAELVAYPTSFDGGTPEARTNPTHAEHVSALGRLAKLMPHPAVDYYHHRWAGYPDRWPSLPELGAAGASSGPGGA